MFDLAETINLNGIRVIALDAVGTLIHPVQPVAATYVEVARQFGVELQQDAIAAKFKAAIQRHTIDSSFDSPSLATSEAIERRWWHGFIAEVLELDSAGAAPIFDALWDYYAKPESWRLYDDSKVLIDYLNANDWPWVIASNFDARLEQICRADPHLSTAARVFPSSVVGWRKPSVNFFRRIEAEMQQPPTALLMVGDDQVADLEAATFATWQAIKLNRSIKRSESDLASLADLPKQISRIRP